MRRERRSNILWGLVLFAAALVVVLRGFDVLPASMFDLVDRAWPVLLLLAGLTILLRDRIPFGGFLALVISLVLVGSMAVVAFSNRANETRTDNQVAIALPDGETIVVSDGISLLEVSVGTLATDVEVLRSLATDRSIAGQFVGSTESEIETTYSEDSANARALLRITETQPNQFPFLEAVGRGKLRLELPSDLALDVAFVGENGDVVFNMSELSLERLNMTVEHGNALVTLPDYAPLSPNALEQAGHLNVQVGQVTVFVPDTIAVRFELNRGSSGIQPEFDAAVYNYLVGDVLENKDYEDAPIKLRYIITAPHGRINIATAG